MQEEDKILDQTEESTPENPQAEENMPEESTAEESSITETTEENAAVFDEEEEIPDKPWHKKATESPAPMPTEEEPEPVEEKPVEEKEEGEEKTAKAEKPKKPAGLSLENPLKRKVQKDTILHMDYKLSFDDVYETFTLLGQRSRTLRTVQLILLALAALMGLLAYLSYDQNFMMLLLVIVVFACAGYIFFVPDSRKKKQATKVMEMDPVYKLKLYKDGTLESPLQGKVKIQDDRKAISFEGPHVFALGLAGKFSYCIPKAYLNEEETEALRQVLQENSRFKVIEKLQK